MEVLQKRVAHMSILEFPHRDSQGMSWSQRLDLAEREADVVAIARDYLASLDPFEVATLPERCKPRKLFDATDIASYAFDLARQHTEEPPAAALVHRMAALFVHANIRLSQILASSNDELGDARETA
jgi:hypothetical protein